jgi:RNase P/RNase MRP subunit p30
MAKQILLTESNFSKLKEKIKKEKLKEEMEIIYSSEDDELNRKVMEKLPIDILLINQKNREDFQKQRNSGFNQVIAKIAKKKDITIGINLDEIIEKDNLKEKAEIISRIKQNVFLCNKEKVKMAFIVQESKNLRNIYDLKSLGTVLGMPTWMTSSPAFSKQF